MSRAQRWTVLVAGVVALLMLLFPPWETVGGHYLGHRFFTRPPGQSAPPPGDHGWALPRPDPISRVSLPLLTAQIAVLWICAGGAFLLLAAPRK